MIEAMRDISYSLESAVADIIDDSTATRANAVEVRVGWQDGKAWIGIINDGDGMSLKNWLLVHELSEIA